MIWWCIDVYCHKNNDTTNFGCNHNLGLSKYPTTSIFCELVPRSRDQLHSPEVASPPICTKNEQLWTWRKRSKAKFEKKKKTVITWLSHWPCHHPTCRWRVDALTLRSPFRCHSIRARGLKSFSPRVAPGCPPAMFIEITVAWWFGTVFCVYVILIYIYIYVILYI
jgi:hypothetical protein